MSNSSHFQWLSNIHVSPTIVSAVLFIAVLSLCSLQNRVIEPQQINHWQSQYQKLNSFKISHSSLVMTWSQIYIVSMIVTNVELMYHWNSNFIRIPNIAIIGCNWDFSWSNNVWFSLWNMQIVSIDALMAINQLINILLSCRHLML